MFNGKWKEVRFPGPPTKNANIDHLNLIFRLLNCQICALKIWVVQIWQLKFQNFFVKLKYFGTQFCTTLIFHIPAPKLFSIVPRLFPSRNEKV